MKIIKNILKIALISLMVYGPHLQSAEAIAHQAKTALFPIFGHYQGGGYHFMQTLWFENLDRENTEKLIPQTVKQVPNHLNTTYFIKINGTYGNNVATDKMEMVPQPWNVMFHGWSKIPTNTSDNVQMGLFEAQGVTTDGVSEAIAYNNLKGFSVNPHDKHYSPNNARFRPEHNRQFMTFGLAAQYKDRSIATYEIIINNQEAQDQLAQYVAHSSTDLSLPGIIDFLQSHEFKKHFKDTDDVRTLDETIKKLSSGLKKDTLKAEEKQFQAALDAINLLNRYESDGAAASSKSIRPTPKPRKKPENVVQTLTPEEEAALETAIELSRAEQLEAEQLEAEELEQALIEQALAASLVYEDGGAAAPKPPVRPTPKPRKKPENVVQTLTPEEEAAALETAIELSRAEQLEAEELEQALIEQALAASLVYEDGGATAARPDFTQDLKGAVTKHAKRAETLGKHGAFDEQQRQASNKPTPAPRKKPVQKLQEFFDEK